MASDKKTIQCSKSPQSFPWRTQDTLEKGHEALLIECNIDDMNPEFFDHISERLFTSGASDVFLNIIMKKGRQYNTECNY